jgi:hypothetical protein
VTGLTAREQWLAGRPPRGREEAERFAEYSACAREGVTLDQRQLERDANGLGHACSCCGNPARAGDPLVIAEGMRMHLMHVLDPASGFYGVPFVNSEAA